MKLRVAKDTIHSRESYFKLKVEVKKWIRALLINHHSVHRL